MDLGIAGRKAIVCASSRGLGRGCAMTLAAEGVWVVLNGRNSDTLQETAAEIRAFGGSVEPVVADVATEAGRRTLLDVCPNPDILVNNAGGPPPGDFRDWHREDWLRAIDTNMLSAVEMIRAVLDGMIDRRFGRIVNITSVAVKAPIGYLGLSNAARCGLTGFVAGLARQISRHNVTINNLLPGSFDTDRLRDNADQQAKISGHSLEDQYRLWKDAEASGRFGTPEELGAACAFLCGARAGYITGQNLLLDGGTYPGTF